jgi:hypothetical protein
MKVISQIDYIVYNGNKSEKALIKDNVYNAENFLNGYIVTDELKQESYFINDAFKKTFTIAE